MLLIAVASFRESLPYYSQPEFAEVNDREGASLKVEKLYHPLIGDPVANSIQMQGSADHRIQCFRKIYIFKNHCDQYDSETDCAHPVLQSITVGSFLKVLTSMALRDNQLGVAEIYYMVEIRSLKRILEECEKPEPVFVSWMRFFAEPTPSSESPHPHRSCILWQNRKFLPPGGNARYRIVLCPGKRV